jgi:hypothetical protein
MNAIRYQYNRTNATHDVEKPPPAELPVCGKYRDRKTRRCEIVGSEEKWERLFSGALFLGEKCGCSAKNTNFIGGEVSNATRYEANKQIRQIGDAAVLDPHFE